MHCPCPERKMMLGLRANYTLLEHMGLLILHPDRQPQQVQVFGGLEQHAVVGPGTTLGQQARPAARSVRISYACPPAQLDAIGQKLTLHTCRLSLARLRQARLARQGQPQPTQTMQFPNDWLHPTHEH